MDAARQISRAADRAHTLTIGQTTVRSVQHKGSWRSGARSRRSSRARQLCGAAAGAGRSAARLEDALTVMARAQTLTASMPSAQSWYQSIAGVLSVCTLSKCEAESVRVQLTTVVCVPSWVSV